MVLGLADGVTLGGLVGAFDAVMVGWGVAPGIGPSDGAADGALDGFMDGLRLGKEEG